MKKLHWYYKFLILFIVFFSMFFTFNRNMSKIVNSSLYKGYMMAINKPFVFINEYNIFNYKNVVKKNESLEKKCLKDDISLEMFDSLKNEIEDLKNLMKLDSTYTGYDFIFAKTITRNKMYWYSTITIDKGSSDGVKTGDAVVGNYGLIGTVKSTTLYSSTVKLISNNDVNQKISVICKVGDSSKVGLIDGYEYPYLIVNLSSDTDGLKIGDSIYTSGMGNLPKNIYVGSIAKFSKDDYGLSNVLYIRPKQDMNDINYIVVLKNQ